MRNLKSTVTVICLSCLVFACGGSGSVETAKSDDINTGSDFNDITNDATNIDPVASIESVTLFLGQTASVDGSGSSDADGDSLSYSWTLLSSPPGSSIFSLSDTQSSTIQFTPDVRGSYQIELAVSDGNGGESIAVADVVASIPLTMLDYRPNDIEYSKSLDRMVLVSSRPNTLSIRDVEAETEAVVPLNLPPKVVSISPDGLYAAVGHDAWVSYVDLANAELINVFAVPANAVDIVLAGNGYIYVFPEEDQWESIYSLKVDTGVVTTDPFSSIYAGTLAKLHPDGKAIYGATVGSSPSEIEKYSIVGGTADSFIDSPYHGEYEMCDGLWMSEDGRRIFTKCGNVFRATDDPSTDMTYNGSLEGVEAVTYITHSSAANQVAVIPGSLWFEEEVLNDKVQFFNYEFLTYQSEVSLPEVIVGNRSFPSRGQYVFYSADGNNVYVVLQADPDSALLNDYSIWKVQ